jgi:putative protease
MKREGRRGACPAHAPSGCERILTAAQEKVMAEKLIGTVVHYFGGPGVAVVKLTDGDLATGDQIHFVGHTTDFTEQVASMEVDHEKVEHGRKGQEVAVKVLERTRHHDRVFKVIGAKA